MGELAKIIKVVSGASGSKRITIPKEISERIGLKGGDYVIVKYEGKNRILIQPVKFIPRQ